MPLKIYYLDDEQDLCEVFQDTYSSDDTNIQVFSEPAKFLDAISTSPPDLCFIDYRLPATTGDIIASKIDERIPKYLITGDINISTKSKFNKILQKPCRSEIIEEILSEFLKR